MESCEAFPSPFFSVVLRLKELLHLCGLFVFCVAFPSELFLAKQYWGTFLCALQECAAFINCY